MKIFRTETLNDNFYIDMVEVFLLGFLASWLEQLIVTVKF